jgi:hypothetical protein
MGSRYAGDRYAEDGYRDGDRVIREREVRYTSPPIAERERPYDRYAPPLASPPRREEPRFEERYFAEERFGPPSRRVERRYYEEDEVYDGRQPSAAGAMVPYQQPEPPPPRPGLLRRQSSLDTFDRKPTRRYQEYDREVHREPERERVTDPPPRHAPPVYDDRDYRYKEREWVSYRRRSSSGSRDREEEVIEEVGEVEKPFPRRGKTRMPRRLVHTRILEDFRYPYHEEVRNEAHKSIYLAY